MNYSDSVLFQRCVLVLPSCFSEAPPYGVKYYFLVQVLYSVSDITIHVQALTLKSGYLHVNLVNNKDNTPM